MTEHENSASAGKSVFIPPLTHNDLPILQGSYRLDGRNYLQWAQFVHTTLKGRKRINHIEGKAPAETDPQYDTWVDEDSLIMTWFWHSMTLEISLNYMFFPTAREIWKNLADTYSMKQDLSACYELENKVFNSRQENLSITEYYWTLNGLWIELDQYQSLKMKCDEDFTTLTQFIEKSRIFKFLSGLNSEFDPIRVQILGKEKLPSLSEVFHIVRSEESRRTVMMKDKPVNGSALASGKGPIKGGDSFFANIIKKSFRDISRSNQTDDRSKINFTVNGQPLSDRVVKKAEKLAGPIQPGNYWYDFRAGFWGVLGGPCLGIIPPFIEEFNYPLSDKCSGGNTSVFVNGRELHQKDLDLLALRGLSTERERSYIIEISGRVLDEDTGEELDSLGKLAPTVEKVKHGFGMKAPRAGP